MVPIFMVCSNVGKDFSSSNRKAKPFEKEMMGKERKNNDLKTKGRRTLGEMQKSFYGRCQSGSKSECKGRKLRTA